MHPIVRRVDHNTFRLLATKSPSVAAEALADHRLGYDPIGQSMNRPGQRLKPIDRNT